MDRVHQAYTSSHDRNIRELQQIETKRSNRWFGFITNFFIDLFDIGNEKTRRAELQRLTKVSDPISKLGNNKDRFTRQFNSFAQYAKPWGEFNAHKNKLLEGNIEDTDLFVFREAVITLLGPTPQGLDNRTKDVLKGYQKEVTQFVQELKRRLLQSISNVKSANNSAGFSALAKQFAFFAEERVKSHQKLNESREEIVKAVRAILATIANPEVAVAFISIANPGVLDAELKKQCEEKLKQYTAWKLINETSQQLLDGKLVDIPDGKTIAEQIAELQQAVLTVIYSDIEAAKAAGQKLLAAVEEAVVNNAAMLKSSSDTQACSVAIAATRQHFAFFADVNDDAFLAHRNNITRKIEESLKNIDSPAAAFQYIERLEQIGEAETKRFDIRLFQSIQDRRQYYQSWKFLTENWSILLDDKKVVDLSEKEFEDFIRAVLWLTGEKKQEGALFSEFIKNLLRIFGKEDLSRIEEFVKRNFDEFKDKLFEDIKILRNEAITELELKALAKRLSFISTNNTRYSEALHKTRTAIVSSVSGYLKNETDPVKLNRYLLRFAQVWPDLDKDPELAALIKTAKGKVIQAHFTNDQRALHIKYKDELEFLRTGNPGLAARFIAKMTGREAVELDAATIERCGREFIEKYVSELYAVAQHAIKVGGSDKRSEEEDKVFGQFLKESIREDIQSIAKPLSQKLVQLTDLRRKQAREKLDRIFGQEKDQPVNIATEVVLPLFAIAEYQRHFSFDDVMNVAGVELVRQFNELLQDSKSIGGEFVAKLPPAALEKMYDLLEKNPDVSIVENNGEFSLASDIIGRSSQDAKQIQAPRYLLLRMVLEFIAADYSALLRGETVNLKRLNEWIAFAIPKLQQQQQQEEDLNETKNGEKLKEKLLNFVNTKFESNQVRLEYERLIEKRVTFSRNSWGIALDLAGAEDKLLSQLQSRLLPKIDELLRADIDYSMEQETVIQLENAIIELRRNMKDSNRAATMEVIAKYVSEKDVAVREIARKKGLERQLDSLRPNIELVKSLFSDSDKQSGKFKKILLSIDSDVLRLLDSQDAEYFIALKRNLALGELLKDAQFNETLDKLRRDLGSPLTKVVDIINQFPESIIRELPDAEADMLRQINYRFAPWFVDLMAKTLSQDNINLMSRLEKQEQTVALKDPAKDKNPSGGFLGLKLFSGSAKAETKAEPQSSRPVKSTEERLQDSLKLINSDVFNNMVAMLANGDQEKRRDLAHLYQLKGISAPIAIKRSGQRKVDSGLDQLGSNPDYRPIGYYH